MSSTPSSHIFSTVKFQSAKFQSAKFQSAIALVGLFLILGSSNQLLRRAGTSMVLTIGGIAIATQLMQSSEGLARQQRKNEQLTQQLKRLQCERQQLIDQLYETTLTATAEITTAHTTIADLETTLQNKTELATQMLTELEAEATGTFNQFSAKIDHQTQLINDLFQQIEVLRQTNTRLTNQQFERFGADTLVSHRLSEHLARN